MLVQALARYADTRLADQLDDPAFESKPVRFFLEVAEDGRFLGFIERTESVARGKKTLAVAQQLNIPKSPVSRNSGLHPLLACDDMKYVLGPGEWTKPAEVENQQGRHDAFIALITIAANETSDPAIRSAARFYERSAEVESARNDFAVRKPLPGSMICLYSNGALVSNPAVREFWRSHYQAAFGERSQKGGQGICLISGDYGPIAATHDKIKGAGNLGGQAAGVSLMSFDKAAFRSYGWEQNANSPVSPSRANAYVLALNDLLKSGSAQRRDHGGVGFVFWTKIAPSDDTYDVIESATPAQVNKLLQLDPNAVGDPDEFYFLGMSGNGGRLLIRHWYHDSLARVKANVKAWFEGLAIANAYTGVLAEPPPLWLLLKAVARDEAPPDRILQLLSRAIEGQPLGRSILAAALNRQRAAPNKERYKPERIGLIRLCTNDLIRHEGASLMTPTLDSGQTHRAYLCGRLLAIYDSLQYQAHRSAGGEDELNRTVADTYYSLASTNPMAAFPRVDDLGQKHLRKLRRDNRPAMVALEREIQVVHRLIAEQCGARFPGPLSLEDQGRFAIGFHHQRAESMARAAERKQENNRNREQSQTDAKEQS
jgi:CRISPR-associated protein Csd1